MSSLNLVSARSAGDSEPDFREVFIPEIVVPANRDWESPGLTLPERRLVVGWNTERWGDKLKKVDCVRCGRVFVPHFCLEPVMEVLRFTLGCRLIEGDFVGEPFVPIDWVADAVPVIFGVMMWDETAREGGLYRLFQEFIGGITRGQMKTTFQMLLIAIFLRYWPRGAEGLFAQQTKDEALSKLVPKTIQMLQSSPAVEGLDWQWVGQSRLAGGGDRFYRGVPQAIGDVSMRLASPHSARTAMLAKGYRPVFGVFDEVGFMPSDAAETLIEEACKKGGNVAPDPLWWIFSTQAQDPAHYQRRRVSYCLEVAKSPWMNPRLYSKLYICDASADIHDPQLWWSMLPLFREGIMPKSVIYQEHDDGMYDPVLMNIFARDRVGFAGDISARFMPRESWIKCGLEGGRAAMLERMAGLPKFVGVDFSETSDLSAMCLYAIDNDSNVLLCPWHWIPDAAVHRLDALTRGELSNWITDGWIEVLPAGEEMPAKVGQRVLDILEPILDEIVSFGYDPHSAEDAASLWRESGEKWKEPKRVQIIKQGKGLNSPIHQLPVAASHGRLLHPNDPVLDFCVMSAFTQPAPEDPDKVQLIKIDRKSAETRIDGAVALCTAAQTRIAWNYYTSQQLEKKSLWSGIDPTAEGLGLVID